MSDCNNVANTNANWKGTFFMDAVSNASGEPRGKSKHIRTGVTWNHLMTDCKPQVCGNSELNAVFGFFMRHLGVSLVPDRKCLQNFADWSTQLVEGWVKGFNSLNIGTYGIKEYIQSAEPRKRPVYEAGWKEIVETGRVKVKFEAMMKGDEIGYLKAPKVRNLFNPCPASKIAGAYFNDVVCSNIRKVVPEFIIGMNTGELEEHLQHVKETVEDDCVWVSWDGSSHDAHQHWSIIDLIDTRFIKGIFDKVFLACEYPAYLYDQVYNCLTKMEVPVACYGKDANKKRKVLFEGMIKGTTFSGHSVRTTLGNTLRVISYSKFVCAIAGIPENAYKVCVAGDDVIMRLQRKYLQVFWQAFWTVYSPRELNLGHGLGQLAKDPKVEDFHIDFLSKFGVEGLGVIMLNRKIDRGLLSGNTSGKIRIPTKTDPGLTVVQHRTAITDSLLSWGSTWPVIEDYIKLRLDSLKHGRGGKIESEYAYVFHSNSHDHSDRFEWLLGCMNMPAIAYASKYIRKAMDFIGEFEVHGICSRGSKSA